MGWLFGQYSRKDVIEDLTSTKTWTHAGENKRPLEFRRTCLAKTYKGSPWAGVLYGAFKIESRGHRGSWVEKDRYILVAMVRCSNLGGVKMWGYKDMDESMHPFYFGCPLKYFELVPKVSCQRWRDLTTKRWATIAKKRAEKRAANARLTAAAK